MLELEEVSTSASQNFYKAFEDCFRGSRETIKERLTVYLPFILPLKEHYSNAKVIDLGCGRGEWLELLKEHQIDAIGVDLDGNMLAACHEQGLNAIQGDAIETLKTLPDNSQLAVTGFHIAEHLPFEILHVLVQEALRVLLPGGLLILETPNAENLIVGASDFYLDPTHIRPLPLPLLVFMANYYGFNKTKALRLQENKQMLNENIPLRIVFRGVSPDCAIVAQKSADEGILDLSSSAFEQEYGINLDNLAYHYDQQLDAKIQQLNNRSIQAEAIAQTAIELASKLEATTNHAFEKSISSEAKAQHSTELSIQAESIAQRALDLAVLAEAKTQHSSEYFIKAESSAQKAFDLATITDGKIQHSSDSVLRTESIAQNALNLATLAETRTQHVSEHFIKAESIAQKALDLATLAEAKTQHASDFAIKAETSTKKALDIALLAQVKVEQVSEFTANIDITANQALDLAKLAESKAQYSTDFLTQMEARISQALEMANIAQVKAQQAMELYSITSQDRLQLSNQLNSILASRSWKMTHPVRWINSRIKRVLGRIHRIEE